MLRGNTNLCLWLFHLLSDSVAREFNNLDSGFLNDDALESRLVRRSIEHIAQLVIGEFCCPVVRREKEGILNTCYRDNRSDYVHSTIGQVEFVRHIALDGALGVAGSIGVVGRYLVVVPAGTVLAVVGTLCISVGVTLQQLRRLTEFDTRSLRTGRCSGFLHSHQQLRVGPIAVIRHDVHHDPLPCISRSDGCAGGGDIKASRFRSAAVVECHCDIRPEVVRQLRWLIKRSTFPSVFSARHRSAQSLCRHLCNQRTVGEYTEDVLCDAWSRCTLHIQRTTGEVVATIEHLCDSGIAFYLKPTTNTQAHQAAAIHKHRPHIRHLAGIEAAHIKARQVAATPEHTAHIRHLASVKMAYVKTCQAAAIREHMIHIRHLAGIEVTHVQLRQTSAFIEHTSHIFHLAGVQVFDTCNSSQILATIEPFIATLRSGIGKRGVEHHLCNVSHFTAPRL